MGLSKRLFGLTLGLVHFHMAMAQLSVPIMELSRAFAAKEECSQEFMVFIGSDFNPTPTDVPHVRFESMDHVPREIHSMLKRESGCVVVVMSSSNVIELKQVEHNLLKTIRSKLMILVSESSLVHLDSMANILVLIPFAPDIYTLDQYCPRRNSSEWYHQVNFWIDQGDPKWRFPLQNQMSSTCDLFTGRDFNIIYRTFSRYVFEREPGTPLGTEIEIIKVLAEYLKFNPVFTKSDKVYAQLNDQTVKHVEYEVFEEKFDMGVGTLLWLSRINEIMDYVYPYYAMMIFFKARYPIPLISYKSLVTIFNVPTWIAVFSTSFCAAMTIWIIYSIYEKNNMTDLVNTQGVSAPSDFFIRTFVGITEPDPIGWFPKASAGTVLITAWLVYATFIVLFYLCNVQAALIAAEYETPIDTAQDVLDRGTALYMSTTMISSHFNFLSTEIQSLISHSNDTGGIYDLVKSKGTLPRDALKDVIENGASYIGTGVAVGSYVLRGSSASSSSKTSFRLSKYPMISGLQISFLVSKNSPYKKKLDRALLEMVESGHTQRVLSDISSNLIQPKPLYLTALGLDHLLLPFVIILVGWLLSTVAFAFRFCVGKGSQRGVSD